MKNNFLSAVVITAVFSFNPPVIANSAIVWNGVNNGRGINVIEPEPIKLNVQKINWDKLDKLVTEDDYLTPSFKTSFRMIQDIYDPIERDKAMKNAPYYNYLKSILYPKVIEM